MNRWIIPAILPFLITAAYAGVSAAPWVPTRRKELKLLLDDMPDPGQGPVIDLGAGTGTILLAVARKYPHARCIGYEISLLPWIVSVLRAWWSPRQYRNVRFRLQSLYRANLSDATVVTCFLLPDSYKKIVPALKGKLQPEAHLAVLGWEFPGVPLEKKSEMPETLPIYWYRGGAL